MQNRREAIVISEGADERDIPSREVVDIPFAGTGPSRGEYESHRQANDNARPALALRGREAAGRDGRRGRRG